MIRVLYAEDDPQIAQMVQIYFSSFAPECAVEVVDSGRRCLDRMAEQRYEVVMVDLMMPELDGLQVLGELAARRDPTPVIMVSGHGQNELAVQALRAGAVDCIDKNSPEFRRVPEIVRRVHARNLVRLSAQPAGGQPAQVRVLLVESSPVEAAGLGQFFAQNAPTLNLVAVEPAAFEADLDRQLAGEALILGPGLGTVPALELLRKVRSRSADLPIIMISAAPDSETAVATFKLGAQDFLVRKEGWQLELVFSLNNALKHTAAARLNVRLSRELAELNRSLEAQVAARTQELRALSGRLLHIQEAERRSIAQELHDQIGQMLTGLRFQLEAGQNAGTNHRESLELTDEILRYVRTLTLQLRPRILDDFGLQPALEWHLNQFRRQTGLTVGCELALPARRLPSEIETAVFRIVQEALTNVARHARGAEANVTVIQAEDGQLIVEIGDRGPGFDVDRALAKRDSLGLAGLVERVQLAGGRIEIFSRANQGTRIHAEFPLPAAPIA
jgi:DNA-binding response OmpR family regulator/anti-sigma regulatory factor (Ser/Thr protein kinase)